MATIQSKVNRVLRLMGVLAVGETPSADDSANVLETINAMLDSWRNDKLLVYAFKDIQVTLINGTATYTIGATGGTVDTAPVKIESIFVRKNNVDYWLREIKTDAEYQAEASKNITADIPAKYLFTHTNPNSTITLLPVPTQANTMYVRVWTPLTSVALADTYSFPPGYEDSIIYNTCIRHYPEYPALAINPTVAEIARTSLASLKRINARPHIAVTQLAKMFTSNRTKVDITAGE